MARRPAPAPPTDAVYAAFRLRGLHMEAAEVLGVNYRTLQRRFREDPDLRAAATKGRQEWLEEQRAARRPAWTRAEPQPFTVRRAQNAAQARWAKETDRTAATAAARQAVMARFEQEADPDGTLDPVERERRAAELRKAHYTRLAHASVEARRQRAAG